MSKQQITVQIRIPYRFLRRWYVNHANEVKSGFCVPIGKWNVVDNVRFFLISLQFFQSVCNLRFEPHF